MSEKEIKDIVTKKANSFIEEKKKIMAGDYPLDEYSSAYWDRPAIQSICEKVFLETYILMKK